MGESAYVCQTCKKPLTAAQVHRKGNRDWTVEYHFCDDCVPCSSRGTGVRPEWLQRPEPTPEERQAHEEAYRAYMAQFEGRGYQGTTRCHLCRDFGVFADTELCPDCDQLVKEMRQESVAEVARLETLITTYCHAHMDRVLAEERGDTDSEKLAELRREEGFALAGLENVMIDVENPNVGPSATEVL